jgi:hypothetical protein
LFRWSGSTTLPSIQIGVVALFSVVAIVAFSHVLSTFVS